MAGCPVGDTFAIIKRCYTGKRACCSAVGDYAQFCALQQCFAACKLHNKRRKDLQNLLECLFEAALPKSSALKLRQFV
jgi:hypothetical protein